MPMISAFVFACVAPVAVDGDTLRCRDWGLVRLLAIDAPELPGHCRPGRACTPGDGAAARRALGAMIAGRVVTCRFGGRDHYGRILARCSVDGLGDLSCAMVARGYAVVRYSRLGPCPTPPAPARP